MRNYYADLSAIRGESEFAMNELQVIERENQRVLTTAQIAEQYETSTQVITNNFNRNKRRYVENKHYFALEGEEKRTFLDLTQIDLGSAKNAKTLYLWTEKGALMLAKSLNTDKAWEAYECLVDTYFNIRQPAYLDSYMIEDPVLRAERWIEEQKERQRLLTTVNVQEQKIKEIQPKATYCDLVLSCTNAVPISLIAKDYGMSARKLNSILNDMKIQYKCGGQWILNQNYAGKGYTKSATHTYNTIYGTAANIRTNWTQKGRLLIYEKLKEQGILPLMEQ